MKLAYITNARIPSERANAVQTVQMCAAFAEAGAEVTLYHPNRRNLPEFEDMDLWDYYGVPRIFAQCRVPCIDLFHLSGGLAWIERPIFMFQTLTFALSLIGLLLREPADLYYSRDPFVLALMVLTLPWACRRMYFEAHAFPTSKLGRALRRSALARIEGTVAISRALARLYEGLGLKPVMIAHDGVSLARFSTGLSQDEARAKLNLPPGVKLVVYTGGLYPGRGLEELIVAMRDVDATLVLVGGKDEAAAARFRKFAEEARAANARFEGHRPPTDIPIYLAAADVLAMPYSRRTFAPGGVTTDWMSPLKMFEYMAACRPIVASDLPALREVLNANNALLIPPDDAQALRDALRRLLSDRELGRRLAEQARRDVEAYTWETRANAILSFASAPSARHAPNDGPSQKMRG
ncbi:MAG TPA: glycosyltransferase family 4 protein [Anaerolineales bacterium]|nr:glycosyltransferase family 4 protein [Anaerolineales bacterium]